MDKQLVSVVLCTYNGASWLAEQIDSILRQTYRPIELIISDDASTDGTIEILKHYDSNPDVRIFYNEKNRGLTRNFEFAAMKARGVFIAFADQDDIWIENKIEKLANSIGNKPLVYSDSLLIDERGNSLGKKLSELKKMYSGIDSRGYVLYSCVWGHGMMITKQLLETTLPVPPGINYDIWIAFRAFLNGGIIYHDEVLTLYRRHPASNSQTLPEKHSQRVRKTRLEAYREKMKWIELMQFHERPIYQEFYKKLLKLYRKKAAGSYVFSLVPFMLKYRKALFMYSHKSFASQFVEMLKQARAVK